MRLALFILITAGYLGADCIAVEGPRIYGRDLASANPAFATLPPAEPIGFAPLPPLRRILGLRDLRRLAEKHDIALGEVADVCFVRTTRKLSAVELRPILEQALQQESATVEIEDFSRYPVPVGKVEFHLTGLMSSLNTTAPVLWRGRVLHEGGSSTMIWARVKIAVERTWVETVSSLAAGHPVTAEQLTIRSGPGGYLRVSPIASIAEIVGRKPIRSIAAGKTVFTAMLSEPAEVERGEPVSVAVEAGSARLAFESTAITSGQVGQTVLVRNPTSGRSFPARVEAKGHVSVAAGSKHENPKSKNTDLSSGNSRIAVRR